MRREPSLVAETKAWLSKAARDLGAARYELEAEPPFVEDIAFHAQQAVEKALKAFLTWHGRAFRKTHNLVELREASSELDPSLEAEVALGTASQVYEAVLNRLPEKVRP